MRGVSVNVVTFVDAKQLSSSSAFCELDLRPNMSYLLPSIAIGTLKSASSVNKF